MSLLGAAAAGTPTSGTPIRVLLADDQALVRAGIATILDAYPDITVVAQVGTGADAVEAARRLLPDVVCMDVQMPEMDGLEATRRIVADVEVPTAVLMLTTFQREDYLVEALGAGASGFLLKNSRPAQLVDAIRSVAAGDALLAPEVTRAVIQRAVQGGRAGAVTVGTPAVARRSGHAAEDAPAAGAADRAIDSLTDRETEVLGMVARGLSNDEIAAELVLGRATVKTHVSNVLMKLALRDRVQAVVFAYRHGLVPPD